MFLNIVKRVDLKCFHHKNDKYVRLYIELAQFSHYAICTYFKTIYTQ